VYIPPPAVRELREVCRGRYQVVRLRARVAQMIRALLLRSGCADVPVTRVFSPRGLAWLSEVQLPSEAGASLERWRRVLTAVHAEAIEVQDEAGLGDRMPRRRTDASTGTALDADGSLTAS
jgi:hypothetical protein